MWIDKNRKRRTMTRYGPGMLQNSLGFFEHPSGAGLAAQQGERKSTRIPTRLRHWRTMPNNLTTALVLLYRAWTSPELFEAPPPLSDASHHPLSQEVLHQEGQIYNLLRISEW